MNLTNEVVMIRIPIVLIFLMFLNTMAAQKPSQIFDASRNGKIDIIKTILEEYPESVNQKNQMGFTPLILAIYNNQEVAASYLIKLGADVDAFDRSGNTALMGAVFKGYVNGVKLLIDGGANVNQQNYNKATALTFAATFGSADIAKILIEAGGNTSIKDSQGKTPLDHAILQDNMEVARIYEKQSDKNN